MSAVSGALTTVLTERNAEATGVTILNTETQEDSITSSSEWLSHILVLLIILTC